VTTYKYPCTVTAVSDTFADHVNRGSVNPGVDYMAGYGDSVLAVAAGTVTDASNDNGGGGGRTIHVNHDDGTGADYLHLSSVAVGVGQWVAAGAFLGASGGSGYGEDWYYGPHLHISFRPNHSGGYGNNGNQDFDAIMRAQGTTPTPPSTGKDDNEMRIVSVPNGTIGLVGEYTGQKYTSVSGNQGFSIGSNKAAYGESTGLTEDQVSTLVSEAATRRNALVSDVAETVLASMSSTQSARAWPRVVGLFVVALVLFIVAAVAPAIFPGATPPVEIVLAALGAAALVLGGFSIPGAIRARASGSVSVGDEPPATPPQHRGDA
jgi:hypothetical protein